MIAHLLLLKRGKQTIRDDARTKEKHGSKTATIRHTCFQKFDCYLFCLHDCHNDNSFSTNNNYTTQLADTDRFNQFRILLVVRVRILLTLLHSGFGRLLCTYKTCWKWSPRASIQAWTRLILFANTFCRSAFRKSLCTYKRCRKWCPRASIQAWTRLILFANTFCRSAFRKSLCTYKRCRKWCPRANNAPSRYRNPHS
jgi:hypothetical protein